LSLSAKIILNTPKQVTPFWKNIKESAWFVLIKKIALAKNNIASNENNDLIISFMI
jgi:hypothetical protein